MRRRTWTEVQLTDAVNSSCSYRQALFKIGLKPTGGNYKQLKKYISQLKLPTSHFKGNAWNKGLKYNATTATSLKDILVENSNYQSYKLKTRLLNTYIKSEYCELCGWAERSIDGRIPLELDHINGNPSDNRIENLQILCPNCHSLRPSHRGRNRRNKI